MTISEQKDEIVRLIELYEPLSSVDLYTKMHFGFPIHPLITLERYLKELEQAGRLTYDKQAEFWRVTKEKPRNNHQPPSLF